MAETMPSALLREARQLLERAIPNPIINRRLARRIALFLDGQTKLRSPESVIHQARARIAHQTLLSIDQAEQAIRRHPDGIEIRAWYLVPFAHLGADCFEEAAWAGALAAMAPVTRTVLQLSQSEGLSAHQIGQALGLSTRAVRRHLRRAIGLIAKFQDQLAGDSVDLAISIGQLR